MAEDQKQTERLDQEARAILSTLTPTEAAVLRYSFGIETSATDDKDIGEKLKIHQDAVDVHRARALRKLRHPSRAKYLESLLGSIEATAPHPEVVVPKAIEEIEQLSPELLDRLRSRSSDIEKVRPDVFEELVGELLLSRGFEHVQLVGRNSDTSADILATRYVDSVGEHRYFVEVKRWRDQIGIEVIDRVHGALIGERMQFGWTAAMIVSIVGFKKFKKYTRQDVARLGIFLKDRDDLAKWLDEYEEGPAGLWLPSKSNENGVVA